MPPAGPPSAFLWLKLHSPRKASSAKRHWRKVQRNHREFWVGTLKRRGSNEMGLVVFEATQQSESEACVPLFEVAENSVGEFRKDVVRQLIGNAIAFGEPAVQAAVDAYC